MEVRQITVKYVCLIFLLLLALIQDIKSYKISNFIIFTGYLLSLLFFHQDNEWTSIYKWICNIIIPIVILFPLFIIKVLGAGDIKLFSVIGGFFGITFTVNLMAISFVVGGVLSLIKLIRHKNLVTRFLVFLSYIKEFHLKLTTNTIREFNYIYYDKSIEGREGIIHFALAIFIAFLLKTGLNIGLE